MLGLAQLATSTPDLNGSSNGHVKPPAAASAVAHTRDNPYLSPLIDKRALTREVSSKQTLHLAFSLAESGLRYESGDDWEWLLKTILISWTTFSACFRSPAKSQWK